MIPHAFSRQRAQRGVAAMEAALIMPVLVLLLVMAVDLSDLIRTDRRLVNATGTVADLVARERTVDAKTFDAAQAIGDTIFSPHSQQPTAGARYAIASVVYDNDGSRSVAWTREINGGALPDPLAHTDQIELENDSVIVVRGERNWQPLLSHPVLGELTLTEVQVARPRLTRRVEVE